MSPADTSTGDPPAPQTPHGISAPDGAPEAVQPAGDAICDGVAVDIDAFLLPHAPTAAAETPPTTVAAGTTTRPPAPARRAASASQADDAATEQPLELQYETMAAWFKGWFHRVVERQQTQAIVWCPQWWSHPEVVSILDALWIAWEGATASTEPDAVLTWWDRATSMIHHLTDPTRGPMARCSRDAHQTEREDLMLPYAPEPPEHFGLILDTGPARYGTAPWGTIPGLRPDGDDVGDDHDGDDAGRVGGHGY